MIEKGVVKFFDSRMGRGFGFITLGSGEEIFFHQNDFQLPDANDDGTFTFYGSVMDCSQQILKGSPIYFKRTKGSLGRPKAAPWCFKEDYEAAIAYRTQRAKARQQSRMTTDQMNAVITSVKSGDKLKVVFADRTFNGDLKGRLYFILGMCAPMGEALSISEMALFTLKAVADSGRWEGCRSYTFTILDGFDPQHFAARTIGRDLLESIERVEK